MSVAFKYAWRNVFRHSTRSIVTLGAIAAGCIAIIFVDGYFQDVLLKMRENYIGALTGHIQIFKKGYSERGIIRPHEYLLEDAENLIAEIRKIEGVSEVVQRLPFAGLLSTGETSTAIAGLGVEPNGEKAQKCSKGSMGCGEMGVTSLSSGLRIEEGEPLSEDDPFGIIVGAGLAENMGVGIGDGLVVLSNTVGGSMNAFDVKLRGVFRTSTKDYEDHALRLPIASAKKLLSTDKPQSLIIFLKDTDLTARVERELNDTIDRKHLQIELKRWEELNDFYTRTQQLFSNFFYVLMLVIGVVVILSVFNTMSMSVIERTSEIGTIMAMGEKPKGVVQLFLLEGLIIGIIGAFIGVTIGVSVTLLAAKIGIPMPPPPGATMNWLLQPRVTLITPLIVVIFSISTAVISSVLPARNAAKLNIADALRHVG